MTNFFAGLAHASRLLLLVVSVLTLEHPLKAVTLAFQPAPSVSRPTIRSTDHAGSSATTTQLSMVATLYGHPGTRSPLVNWAAYEVGIELEMGDLQKNPHPFGQIPCLTDDDDILVFESGAILQYFHQKTTAKQQWNPAEAAAITSWITWANASLDPICFLETPDGKVYDTGLKQPNRRISQLDQMLSSQKFLMGLEFSLADVAVASYLLYVLQFFPGALDTGMGSRWPNLKRYMKDCASRDAYGKAFGPNVQNILMEQLSSVADESSGNKENKKLFGMF